MVDFKQVVLDTPEKTITVDTDRDIAMIVDYHGSAIYTSYFHISDIIFYERQDDNMTFSLPAIHNIEVLRYMLKAMGIENYTWLRYGYQQTRERISLTFTDDADYAFFKFKFFNQIKKANSAK